MGKPKQQVISRFFAPRPPASGQPPPAAANPSSATSTHPKPPPKISATVSFSPSATASKRFLAQTLTPSPKKHKLSPPPTTTTTSSSLHQCFLQKLLEPSEPPPPPSTTKALTLKPQYTPLEQQVIELKSQHPDVLLLVEVGYKYRFFGEDAAVAARVLGIFAHVDHNFLTASIPTFRLGFHVRRLVAAGCKVGVVKQTETAAIKAHGSNRLGPFSRGLSALYTRATVDAAEDMGDAGEDDIGALSSNYLMCIVEKGLVLENKGCEVEGSFEVRIGMVAVEVSTGEVIHGEFNDNVMRSGLEAVILSLSPSELLLGEPLSATTRKLLLACAGPSSNIRVECTSRDCFNDGGALAEVMSLYENIGDDPPFLVHEYDGELVNINQEENRHPGIEGIMSMPELTVQSLALLIRHLKKFGLERVLCLGASFQPFSSNIEMTLSSNALHQLEILKNKSDGSKEGSLLQAIDRTYTTFGSRLLKHWIPPQFMRFHVFYFHSYAKRKKYAVTHPLCDRNSILARLDAVSELAESMGSSRSSQDVVELEEEHPDYALIRADVTHILSSVLMTLGKSPDVQRGITRIFHRTAKASEFIGVIQAILNSGKQLQKLHVDGDDGTVKIVKSGLLRRLIFTASLSTATAHAAKLLSSLNKDAANQGDILNLFNASNDQFPEVAMGRIAVQMAQEKLDLLIIQYRKQLGMRTLDFVTVSGTTHLIELPSDARAPSNWVKVSSTKKATRYHPPEVLTAMDVLMLAKEELNVACRATWDKFLLGFGKYYAQFQAAVQALAALDCLHALAILSRYKNFVRPVFVDDDEPVQIDINSGRHPILESILGDNFVPNNTKLQENGEYCQIVTGPNMGGKSCYIRQVALIAIMAQVGCFVPASSAKLHVLDGVYTRMGASDSIQQGTSTFFEELSEASHIIHNCSSRSLVIIDELGRGTSTHDGVAIAYATLQYLLKQKKCLVLFVTHYPKILDILNEFEGSVVGAYHVSYVTSHLVNELASEVDVGYPDQAELTFLYKVLRGASDKSFGLNVARLAQIPSSCVTRAAVMAAKLEAEESSRAAIQSQRFLVGTPMQLEEVRNCSDKLAFQCGENGDFEDFTEVCYKVLSYVRSALSDADPENSLIFLKEARKLALNRIKRGLVAVLR